MDYFILFVTFLPALGLLLTFGFGLVVKLNVPAAEIKKDFSYEPKVSVLLPVYNEGAHVLETINSILRCNYPPEKLNIIAFDDCSSDDSFAYIQQAERENPTRVQAFKNPTNAGKHHSLSNASKKADGDILICIDSDCIFHTEVIRELVSCFAESNIGAVGGRVGVSNPNENIITQCQSFVYYFSFNIIKAFENLHRNVVCISGCMFAVRQELFKEIEPAMTARNWFGIGVRDGEDRYMTHLLVLKGYKTYINNDAQCWTSVPNNLKQLFMQQLRWRRSGLRDLFWTLRHFSSHTKIMSPLRTTHLIAPAVISTIWILIIPFSLVGTATLEMRISSLACWMLVFCMMAIAYNFWTGIKNPEQKIDSPLLLPLICLWMIVNTFFITALALFTFDVGTWGTRESVVTNIGQTNA
ncbi:glycosyltransferase [Hydromonas duriensis]|uniref:Cellulose synthase/poly-beta-1,6-N-acetylglucosamine synthase-like glycosyltransferase n=1 Tax=Hydromonas duriensis TaxID=1527608 RepID=A0A4R6Y7F1_9BURK|nr:glycosyltransferase family 2 protein [Hydromonas duriensis]TDR31261.1 cellulose synthase/poly-beta-1,6-N-acetylglucosamine synthase-like glycosyltransferase [Hydromonas duriensis]